MARNIQGILRDGKGWFSLPDVQKRLDKNLGYLIKSKGITPTLSTIGGKQQYRFITIDDMRVLSAEMALGTSKERGKARRMLKEIIPECQETEKKLLEDAASNVDEPVTETMQKPEQEVADDTDITTISNLEDEAVQIFKNEKFGNVHVAIINGEVWFAGIDVATALGYVNTSEAIREHVYKDDKLTERFARGTKTREIVMINESGLYSLILSSKLPSAVEFKRWVTSEVLPAVRKYGVYATKEARERLLTDPDFIIEVAASWKKDRDKMLALQAKVDDDAPKVAYANAIGERGDLISVEEFAKTISGESGVDIGRDRLFKFMREIGVIQKDGHLPYQIYINQGYFEVVESVKGKIGAYRRVYITKAGRMWLFKKVLEKYATSEASAKA